MRRILDILIVLMIIGIGAGVVLHRHHNRQSLAPIEQTQAALSDLQAELKDRFATEPGQRSLAGYPIFVKPDWFATADLPINPLADTQHPWLDVAPPGDENTHPPDPVLTQPQQAGFWYNPNNGVFRARVNTQQTDRQTLSFYNQINQSALDHLDVDSDALAKRKPLAYRPQWHQTLATIQSRIDQTESGLDESIASTTGPTTYDYRNLFQLPEKAVESKTAEAADLKRKTLLSIPIGG